MQLRQAIDGLGQSLGVTVWAIDGLEGGRISEPMIRAHVDDPDAAITQLGGHVLGRPVGQTEHGKVRCLGHDRRVELGERWEVEAEKRRQGRGEALAGAGVRAEGRDLEGGVLEGEAKKLGAGISGGADNGDADQRLLNWKRLRAPERPYFLRSTMRASRVTKPACFNALRHSPLNKMSARVMP